MMLEYLLFMAKMNFLKPGEISKKPEYLSHIQILEEKIKDIQNKYTYYINDSRIDALEQEQRYKWLESNYKQSRRLNVILFILSCGFFYYSFFK
jgi:hypothetical protein